MQLIQRFKEGGESFECGVFTQFAVLFHPRFPPSSVSVLMFHLVCIHHIQASARFDNCSYILFGFSSVAINLVVFSSR